MTNTDHWRSEQYQANAAFVPQLGEPLIGLLAPQAGEKILDIGCGDGILTAQIAEMCDQVVGIDASENMIQSARQKGLDAHVLNAQKMSFQQSFDAIFSNAALHWMLKPEQVLKGCYNALRGGGRFVAEMGGLGNVRHIAAALNHQRTVLNLAPVQPWFFPSQAQYKELLEEAGFTVAQIELFDRPTPLPGHIRDWLSTFGHAFFSGMTDAQQEHCINSACQQLSKTQQRQDGTWFADYVRLRFIATKPE